MSLSLGGVTLTQYHRALVSDHWVTITGQIMDLEHNYVADISEDIYDGQVSIDANGSTSRSLQLKLLDPSGAYGLDSATPLNGALYYDRMIRIVYTIDTWWMANPVSCAIFTGPVSAMSRDGVFLNIDCVGKEIMLQGEFYQTRSYKKGRSKRSVMLDILASQGEASSSYDIPRYKAAMRGISKDMSFGREDVPWKKLQGLASGMGYQLFYDGRGILRLRYKNTASVFEFRTGDGGSVLSDPQLSYDDGDIKNTFWFVGGKKKGHKKKAQATYHLPASHPLSSTKLGRRGKKRYLLMKMEDGNVKSASKAYSLARNEGRKHLYQSVSVSTTTLVIPHLDPFDWVTITNESISNKLYLTQYSIPLLVEGDASVGVNRRVQTRRVPNRPRPNKKRKVI